jgi:hypothetical protein
MAETPRTVLVIGDAVCDHNYYRGNRQTADSTQSLGVRVRHSGGGALLLREIIDAALSNLPGWKAALAAQPSYEALPSTFHSYCLWEPQISNPDEKDKKKQFAVWRAVEPPLGYGHLDPSAPLDHAGEKPPANEDVPICSAAPGGILVIDDAGLAFRHDPYKQHWPFVGTPPGKDLPRWLVLKVTGAVSGGAFWDRVKSFEARLVLIVSADDLRRGDVRIGRGLSWESTAEDLSCELRQNPALKPLVAARHLIVTFGSDGAYWLDNEEGSPRSMLVFDAGRAEGEWAERQGKGAAFGYLSCFTAAVVRALACAEEERTKEPATEPDFEAALAAGLNASRACLRLGHGRVYVKEKQTDGSEKDVPNTTLGFPFEEIASSIHVPEERFASAPIPPAFDNRGTWTMLDEWHLHARSKARPRPHFEAALAVAMLGPGALERFPVAQFGDLSTVDRNEIESLRTIRHLIRAYEGGGAQKRPLSLGVFGPPGAGKSFGVTQIAKAVLGSTDEDILTFNLSQFNDASDLNGALHRVRDRVLSGRTPVVFWDEFDSQDYKWLQYLLAPMQDGAFQDGQVTHKVGKCVFVFAGATSATFDAFGPRQPEDVSQDELQGLPWQYRHVEEQWQAFVLKKGPDFKSRLVAYLNVLGPNPRRVWTKEAGGRRWQDDAKDVCYPIRRALFIRSQFKLDDGDRLQLDRGVVESLLEVPCYKSGSRSLEFLCGHLRQHSPGVPTRSRLPGPQLLDLHVDAEPFWSICERDAHFIAAAPALARELHENWLNKLSDEERANKPHATSWELLRPDYRASNVAQAARIPRVLALVGLRVVEGPALAPDVKERLRQTLREHVNVLAEAEHNHWMVERMLNGWRHGRTRDEDKRLHESLIPYAQLPRVQQRKDVVVIEGDRSDTPAEEVPDYITRVQRIGFRVEPIPPGEIPTPTPCR